MKPLLTLLLFRWYLTLLLSLLAINANAGNTDNLLSAKINKAQNNGEHFIGYTIFDVTFAPKHTELLSRETLYKLQSLQVSKLLKERPNAISLSITNNEGRTFTLDFLKNNPFSEDVNIGYYDTKGRHRLSNSILGLFYQGAIAGIKQSFAALSITNDGEVAILFGDSTGNYVFGKLEDESGNYILYNDRDLKQKNNFNCGNVMPSIEEAIKEKAKTANKGTTITVCKRVKFHWEASYSLYQNSGSNVTTTLNFVTTLLNNVQTLYANDGIAVELKSLDIWSTTDPYNSTNSTTGLNTFQQYWNAVMDSFDGDVAHLLTRQGTTNGGKANINVLCSRTQAYAYSDLTGAVSTVPLYTWDVNVVTHETGHNFGSMHTQWCGWNTGVGGSCGAIDNCAASEIAIGCLTSCSATYTTGSGTIMSYCHLNRGINFSLGFGPLPKAVIQSSLLGSSCLTPIISQNVAVAPICNANDGAVTLSIASNNLGVQPFTYSWSNGATSQSINGLSSTGNYSVTITDDNSCTNAYNASVPNGMKSGNGNYIGQSVLCGSTKNATLSATLPTNLSTCYSVGWLRTTTPITTMSAAQTAYTNGLTTGDVFFSDNAATVSNSIAGIFIAPTPATCAGGATYYFTPFITKKPKTLNTISQAVNSSVNYNLGGTVIGRTATLPSVATAATSCDLLNTTTEQLSIVVSSYTGRPNYMKISVSDVSGITLLYRYGLAGIGTYNFNLGNIAGGSLQDLLVTVYDDNCASGCVASTNTFTATRTIVYPAITVPTFETANVCTPGTSASVAYSPQPLPIQLLNFTGIKTEKGNHLFWEITNEANISDYEIERSNDAMEFKTIGDVKFKTVNSKYEFLDQNALPIINYYRLKFIGINGEARFSKTITISGNTDGDDILVYPTPFVNTFTVLSGAAQNATLTDVNGKLIMSIKLIMGENKIQVPIALSKGIYFLKTELGQVSKLVKE